MADQSPHTQSTDELIANTEMFLAALTAGTAWTVNDHQPTPSEVSEVFAELARVLLDQLIQVETERTNMAANAAILGECWRGDWSQFDGRELRSQLEDLTETPDQFAAGIGACMTCQCWCEYCTCPNGHAADVVEPQVEAVIEPPGVDLLAALDQSFLAAKARRTGGN